MSSSRKSERKRKPSSRSAPSTDKTRSKTPRRSPAAGTAARAKKPAAKARAAQLRFEYGHETLSFATELRDVVIFPGMMVPLLVGRPASVAAIEAAMTRKKFFAVVAQHDPQETEPEPEDLHDVGTVVRAIQILKIPDGTMKILVEGVCRYRVERVGWRRDYLAVKMKLAEPRVRPSSENCWRSSRQCVRCGPGRRRYGERYSVR